MTYISVMERIRHIFVVEERCHLGIVSVARFYSVINQWEGNNEVPKSGTFNLTIDQLMDVYQYKKEKHVWESSLGGKEKFGGLPALEFPGVEPRFDQFNNPSIKSETTPRSNDTDPGSDFLAVVKDEEGNKDYSAESLAQQKERLNIKIAELRVKAKYQIAAAETQF
ncbi:predicted protein [Sclerotinia sclerotiorum 1980 UF-70]|uniref:Uncharacterized protein n=2 Tax=Sclerotinia sclerotiorum (strain ATCC 18683 / 1980 / Ss-1) TaxID=665079 RepID=A7E891_SCLS1|nr:predicted protein [Sclerotinia sclerotiorum 1980 UF-70]APA06054.1 hypothetical protein sscle_01g008240 [Sclerotinia sclerotiorum 1980 UF-70]EDN96593.1 predicted protein [Sclerotinia sclerotiorum 1980 UF-70]